MPSVLTPPCDLVLPLLAEALVIERRRVAGDTVRVATLTHAHERLVDEELTHERIDIQRVPVGRVIDAVPLIREEGDVTIVPVVEEEDVVVVQRRLILREEIHMRRVRVTERHRETVTVRRQDVDISRIRTDIAREPFRSGNAVPTQPQARPILSGDTDMTDETIVAIYDTNAQADAAVRDLKAAQIPAGAISRHAATEPGSITPPPAREPGFWASLFGGEPDHDEAVYNRSLETGSTVVTVKVAGQSVGMVTDILERHDPVDLDERASGYGLREAAATTVTPVSAAPVVTAPGYAVGTADATEGGNLQLAEETLRVGKRAVNRGTTRVRRFVVETPVEEQVSLRNETVTVERRAVTGGSPVKDADFTERTVEMTETDEEAVVDKTARVIEEVVVRKDVTDRVETVRDTVRREDVEIETIPAAPVVAKT